MALKREDAIRSITEGIAWIAMICKIRGGIHLFDTNVVSHDFWCQILNATYGLQLQVMDRIKPNFPAIDLGDVINKRAFQVTAEKSGEKMQTTLDKYVQYGLEQEYGKLQVLVIGERQSSYKSLAVPSALAFVWEEDIIDTDDLTKVIEGLDSEKLERVADVVRREVRVIREHESASAPAAPPSKTTVHLDGFQTRPVNFGTLYKLRFRLEGADPGVCRCEISVAGTSTFAKWDDRPNPLRDDDLSRFVAAMVPDTFDQRLYVDLPYSVPILISAGGVVTVFDGWWFGRNHGYGNHLPLDADASVRITLRGSGFHCSHEYRVGDVLGE